MMPVPSSQWRRSIRWRLQIWYAAILCVIVFGMGGGIYLQSRWLMFDRIDHQLSSLYTFFHAALKSFPEYELRGPFSDSWREFAAAQEAVDSTTPSPGPSNPVTSDEAVTNPSTTTPPDSPPTSPSPLPPAKTLPRSEVAVQSDIARSSALRDTASHSTDEPVGTRESISRRREELLRALDPRSHRGQGPPPPVEHHPYAIIWRADGTLLYSRIPSYDNLPPISVDQPPSLAEGARFIRHSRGFREFVGPGPEGTVILVGRFVGADFHELQLLAVALVAVSILFLAIGLTGGWIMSGRLLQPIEQISQTAAAIGGRDLSRRIDRETLDVELTGLATVLNEMFDRLEMSFDQQRRFASDASHELRTPLSVLYTNLQLTLSRPRSEAEYREAIESGLRSAGRMRELLDGLLTLARADELVLIRQKQPVDLGKVCQEVIEQSRDAAAAKQIELRLRIQGPTSWVSGEALLLSRVVSNLVANGIRYTPNGGRVDVQLTGGEVTAQLLVRDTGRGIALEDQPKIFQRFFRADAARSRLSGGYGLGLALCQSLVQLHGGQISFQSTPGAGTTFEVVLPRVQPGEAEVAANEPASPGYSA